jgi:predicted ATPase/DNA-binding NarL/FixJ family response regulator/transcriptional regulator with XRE-family HTH domain
MQRTDDSADLGGLLRRHRLDAGLTQEALAERAEVGLRSIQGIERGERRPHRATIRRLVGALDLSAEQCRRVEALTRDPTRRPRNGPARLALVPPRSIEPARASRPRRPAPLTSFVGRQCELAEVAHLLAASHLVTLTGPPGVGKSRLALEVAAAMEAEFADGVAFVSLAAIRDPDLVLPAIAQAMRIEGFERQPLVDRLAETLSDRRALLVLDNFEQVVAAAPLVARLLEGCPKLRVLATSRSRLRVRGEREFVVPPLAVSGCGGSGSLAEDPMSPMCEAGRLFFDRARDAGADLVPGRENARAIDEICRRLDGLPLAIELAAARGKVLSPPALLAGLADRFGLLTAGPRDLPARQQTLRDAIAWSHDLLDAGERAIFRRLAVFVDGFTVRAAGAVCEGTLDGLASLVDHSLVQPEAPRRPGEDGEPRFRMLETIREFAREQLAASGEEAALQARHAEYFLAHAEQREPVAGPPGPERLPRLAREFGNLRAALRFLIDHQQGEPAARLATGLGYFWKAEGYVDEGRAWLGEILGLLGEASRTLVRANLLLLAGRLAFTHSDNALARRRVEESLAIYREIGDRRRVATALFMAGLIARWQGQYDLAWRKFEEDRAIWQELDDPSGLAQCDDALGVVAFWMGDGARGRALLESALAQHRRLGDRMMEGYVLYNLGFVAHGLGDHSTARACYEERLAIARRVGFRMGIGDALGGLGDLALDLGDLEEARTKLAEALRVHGDLGNRREIAHVLECFASLAALQNHSERAMRLRAAAAALREMIGEPIPPDQARRLERRARRLRRTTNDDVFARARAAGQAMTMEAAVEDALGGEASPEGSPAAAAARAGIAALSEREEEVASLIAAGLTNRQIAARLVVAERTADAHVSHILDKLGFATRSQIAVWAATRRTGSSPTLSPPLERAVSPDRR